ncbi:1 3-beta-glucanosyltransferase gel4 [Xanthoria parietina]
MKFGSTLAAAATLVVACAAADLDPIVIKGSKFFYKTNGTEFFMKGIAYQQDYSSNGTISGGTSYTDPLADQTVCARDIPLMAQLQTNTIRVYALDPTKNHDQCMQMLAAAGIYVVADLGEPTNSINRDSPQWNQAIYQRYTAVVDNLAKYTNTLGFFAGNEVTNMANNTEASAFVKAAVRDVKAYIVQKKYRPLGVGYATNDDDQRTELAQYFNCGDPSASIDFWGYNIYSWCGQSSYRESHYQERTQEFSTYNVPVFFAEYGCNTEGAREFDEVAALYGNEMTKVWSGGIVYMYYQEANDYGLVSVGSDEKATKLPDFTALASQIANVTPSGVAMSAYLPTNKPQACPRQNNLWAASEKLPPSPNNAVCSCMVQSLNCTANSDISDDDMQTNFDYLCDPNNGNYCSGILANGSTGVYGAYSMCAPKERIAWAFNAFFMDQTKNNPQNTDPCNFKGAAKKQTAKANGDCRNVVNQAGDAGTGVVTGAPTATGGSSGGSSAATTGAASALIVPGFNAGMLQMAAYITFAALIGASMVLL